VNHIEAMKLALEALESNSYGNTWIGEISRNAIAALRQALEQPDAIEAAVRAENEACAKACEVEASVIVTNASEQYQEGRAMGATVCAAAIRQRGKE
jgi:hypothetical protein